MNFDENTINKLKDMMDKGELNDVISKISPEMIQNFSSAMSHENTNNIDMNTLMKMKTVMEKLNVLKKILTYSLIILKKYKKD